MSVPRSLPLKVTTVDGKPSVRLGDIELATTLARDGLQIRYVEPNPRHLSGPSVPEVTLTFGPGALELDFDVDLLEALLDQAKAVV